MKNLLEVKDLTTCFFKNEKESKVVDAVSFSLAPGRTLGIVGESGCGKSVTSLSIMRLIPEAVTAGEIWYNGVDLMQITESQMRSIRGSQIAMIFQEPMTALNPTMKIGRQITEVIQLHRGLSQKAAQDKALRLLSEVGIQSPKSRLENYPHELSGGMRQRVMIAMAVSCEPALLIADEPTTALDVTIQAQILDLLRDLQKKRQMAMILISHDLAVISQMADEVLVMNGGRVVEQGLRQEIFSSPRESYTQQLIATQLAMSNWGGSV